MKKAIKARKNRKEDEVKNHDNKIEQSLRFIEQKNIDAKNGLFKIFKKFKQIKQENDQCKGDTQQIEKRLEKAYYIEKKIKVVCI